MALKRIQTDPKHSPVAALILLLISLQKKIIRAMTWSRFDAPSRPIFLRYGLLRFSELTYYNNACSMYEVVFKLNQRLSELVTVCWPQHTYDTRNKHLISGIERKLISTSQSITLRGPQIWNELEESMKTLPFHSFKRALRGSLLNSYN